MNILITGITGFLGRNLTNYIKNHQKYFNAKIVGTAFSESKLSEFINKYPDITTYIVNLSSGDLRAKMELIIKTHNINYIIHCAAMKHVDICQENPNLTMKVNFIATNIIMDVAKNIGINNVIALSTDKANNPCNTYGISKYLMQNDVMANKFSIYQGANFFWSDGSVLDIWFNQYKRKKPITFRSFDYVRYFNTIEHVCERIIDNIDEKNKVILPNHVYVIKIKELLDCFCKYFDYHNTIIIPENEFEKSVEILKDDVQNIITLNKDDIYHLIDEYFKNYI